MNLGFYYHVEAAVEHGGVSVPSHLGLQILEMARQAGSVTLYAHSAPRSPQHDMVLDDPHVRCIDLGPRRSAPAMTFRPGASLSAFHPERDGVDVIVIRGPSALLPAIRKAAGDVPVALQIVGDALNWTSQRNFPAWRNALIKAWARYYTAQQERAARGALVLAKSPAIRMRSGDAYPGSVVSFTSSLPQAAIPDDVGSRSWSLPDGPVRLLYTGRIVEEKGLFEALDAVAELASRGIDVRLDLIGFVSVSDPTARELERRAAELGVGDRFALGGYRAAGPALQGEYARADIYLFPTYAEGGVSKTIIEAMADGIPVVTTDIPAVAGTLIDGDNAVLVRPRSVGAIADGVERLVRDDAARERIGRAGHEWARSMTIERSTQVMLDHLRRWLQERHADAETAKG